MMKSKKTLFLLAILVNLFNFSIVSASSPNVSESFNSTTSIKAGSLVSLTPNSKDTVELSSLKNQSSLIGVATSDNDSLIEINPGSNKVQVATNGTVNAIVSTLNGDIKTGDRIAVSQISGIGTKSSVGNESVGIAESTLSKNTPNVISSNVKFSSGKTQTIYSGYVKINISIGVDNSSGSENLNYLQKLVKSVTGKTVSTGRILISLALAILAISTLVTLIYSSIYATIVAVGRNPLAKSSIISTLIFVILTCVFIVVISGGTIYYILK